MSDQIATSYSQKYNTGIELLAQQFAGVTAGTCREEQMDGKRAFFDQVGLVRMQPKSGRAVDIPVVDTPQARRSVTARDYYMRDFIDEFDRLKVLNDPTNAFSEAQAAAAVRQRDKVVIDAALGVAWTGEEGTVPVTLPSAQMIDAGGTGFTLAKLQQAVRIIKSANALMPGDGLHCFWTARQEEEFINTTEVKSIDFNNQKVMVDGELRQFYGVSFHRLEDIADDGDGRMLPKVMSTRHCVLWAKSGLLCGVWKAPFGKVEWLPERHAYQVMAGLSAGATRMQEAKVVRIDVVEA